MKRYGALFCIFMLIGFTSGQEPESTKQEEKSTRHILRFCTSQFNNVSNNTNLDKLKIPTLANEVLSQNIINEFKEKAPENLQSKIYDLPINATAEQFFNAIQKIEENIKPTDEVIIYISSYGVEYTKKIKYRYGDNDNGQSLFIASNEPVENWVSMVELAKLLSRSKLRPAKKLVIANCSRFYLGQSDDNTTIGKKWTNNNESNDKDEEGRLIVNNDLVALEEGRTDLDLNIAIIFSCSSGLGTTRIKSKDVGQSQEVEDVFEKTLEEILRGGRRYNSLENLFENVKRKTNIKTISETGKPQVPTMIVFARNPEAYTDMVHKWQIGNSAEAEINDEFDHQDLNINSERIRTIEDAIGKTKKIDFVLARFQQTLKAIPEITKTNDIEIYQPLTGEKLMAAGRIVGTGEAIASRSGVSTYNIGGYLSLAGQLVGGIRRQRVTEEYQEPDEKQLKEIKMSFDSTASDLKKAASQLKETDNAIKQNRIDYSLIDLTKLFEENKKLRRQLGLETGLVEEQPQPEIYVPRRRGFFR